jgi:hypothetical protein
MGATSFTINLTTATAGTRDIGWVTLYVFSAVALVFGSCLH